MPRSDAQVATPPSAMEGRTALLEVGANSSLFEGLIPRPSEFLGASSSTIQHVISKLLLNLMFAIEISNMV